MPNTMTRSSFCTVLEYISQLPHGTLKESDSRATVATWSSLADVQILTVVSSEFGIEPDAPLMEAETIGDLVRLLEARDAFLY